MIQVYLPNVAIILMLWLGFWVSLREVSARVRVVSIALTTMITQMVGIMIVFPDTVQMEPLMVWNAVCLLFMLLAFIEYIVVHNMYISLVTKRKKESQITSSLDEIMSDEHSQVRFCL